MGTAGKDPRKRYRKDVGLLRMTMARLDCDGWCRYARRES